MESIVKTKESETIMDSYADNIETLKIKKKPHYFAIIAVILIVCLVVGYIYVNRTCKDYVVEKKLDREDETAMEYLSFQNGFIKYNVDGISYENEQGHIVWTEAFTMTQPRVVTKGEYVAVANIGNNEYNLYNASKKIGSFTTKYPISDIQIAKQGLVAVTLEDEKENYIMAFDKEGKKCVEIKTTINKNGYPFAIALSEDGTKLAASYVTIQGTQVESSLTFYNFGNVGKNEVDRQVGYKKFTNQLIPRIEFVNNDTVAAFGDKRIILYAMKQKPKELMNRKVKHEIKSILYNSKYIGYVYNDDSLPKNAKSDNSIKKTTENAGSLEEGGESQYILEVFNLKGRAILNQTIDFNYTNIHSTPKEIIVVSGNKCQIIKYNGFIKYNGGFNKEVVNEFFPTTRNNQYILITDKNTEKIRIK